MTTKNGDLCCHGNALMFGEPDISSLMDRPNTSSKTIRIPNTRILLEIQFTIYAFCNGELLTQIHKTNVTLGMKSTNTRGHLSGYGWVWLHPGGIANILSVKRTKEKHRVTFDSAMDNFFHVHKMTGRPCNFRSPAEGYLILTL